MPVAGDVNTVRCKIVIRFGGRRLAGNRAPEDEEGEESCHGSCPSPSFYTGDEVTGPGSEDDIEVHTDPALVLTEEQSVLRITDVVVQ